MTLLLRGSRSSTTTQIHSAAPNTVLSSKAWSVFPSNKIELSHERQAWRAVDSSYSTRLRSPLLYTAAATAACVLTTALLKFDIVRLILALASYKTRLMELAQISSGSGLVERLDLLLNHASHIVSGLRYHDHIYLLHTLRPLSSQRNAIAVAVCRSARE